MTRVLIVGAGPAGAALAHLLVHRGIGVTLLERQQDFDREFRGEVLMPSGLEAIEELGLGEELAAIPGRPQKRVSAYLNKQLLFDQDLPIEFLRGRFPLAVSQPALLEMIIAAARKSPHFTFERGASAKDLIFKDGRVIGVRVRTSEGEKLLYADLIVGADGRASVVRKFGDFGLSRTPSSLDVVWCKIPCPENWESFQFYAGKGHLLLGYRSWDDQLQLAWVILKGTFGELKSRGINEWVEQMAEHVAPDFAAHIRAHIGSIRKPFLLDVVSDCVERWSVPGALVIGDAAHTMSPVGGQGINIALRDTIIAANHLVPVLSESSLDPSRLAAALLEIEKERMPEVNRVQEIQALPPKVVLSHAWWGEPLRWAMSGLIRNDHIRAALGVRAGIFPLGVTDVRLSV